MSFDSLESFFYFRLNDQNKRERGKEEGEGKEREREREREKKKEMELVHNVRYIYILHCFVSSIYSYFHTIVINEY